MLKVHGQGYYENSDLTADNKPRMTDVLAESDAKLAEQVTIDLKKSGLDVNKLGVKKDDVLNMFVLAKKYDIMMKGSATISQSVSKISEPSTTETKPSILATGAKIFYDWTSSLFSSFSAKIPPLFTTIPDVKKPPKIEPQSPAQIAIDGKKPTIEPPKISKLPPVTDSDILEPEITPPSKPSTQSGFISK